MDYARLQDLLDELERGNRYHICVVFFGAHSKDCLRLRFSSIIHANPVCDAVKQRANSLKRCLRCRAAAFRKARLTQAPFGGYCINGVYEYCHPIFREDKLYCMIFIGNILRDREIFFRRSGLSPGTPLLQTMDTTLDDAACASITSLVESYIQALLELSPQDTRPEQNNAVVAAMQADLDRYFAQNTSLSEMARIYHYNEKYLGRLFKTQVGISFGQYLNQRRLEYSAQLLKQSNHSILDISQRAGFNNVTYFNRLFRRQFGQSPSQYRKCKKS